MTRKLIINDGLSERQLLVVANLVVGRDPLCDISGDNSLLSRRHAEFVVRGVDVFVRDLGSRNGVYVNGARTAEERLRPGDSLRIGHLQFQYVEDATPLTSALAAAAADATSMIPNVPLSASGSPGVNAADAVDEDRTKFVPGPARQPAAVAAADDDEFTKVVTPPRPAAAVVKADTLIGAPEDDEHTRLVRPPAPVKKAVEDDEERTRLVRPPTAVAPPAPVSTLTDHAEELTRVIRPPQSQVSGTVMVASQSVGLSAEDPVSGVINVANQPTVVAAADDQWPAFVFSQLAILVVVVAIAIGAPFQFGEGNIAIGLLAAVVVTLIATYITGSRIVNRVKAAVARTEHR